MSPDFTISIDEFHSGFRLSESETAVLELQVAKDSDAVRARTMLAGYYFHKFGRSSSSTNKNIGASHVLWFVQNLPDTPFLKLPIYLLTADTPSDEAIQNEWQLLVASECSSTILENAAQYFKPKNPNKSISLIEQAVRLDPTNARLLELLSDLYAYVAAKELETDIYVSKSVSALEAYIYKEENTQRKITAIARLAELARESHNLPLAKQSVALGLELSQAKLESKITIDAIHSLQTTRGLIFLDEGNVSEAVKALESSQPIAKTPVFSSFGPQFALANELLKLGEKEAVCIYLNCCLKVWKNGRVNIVLWLLEIKLGRKPVLRT